MIQQCKYFIMSAITMGSFSAIGQDVNEAYNLSNLTVQGTARSMGFGNALGSIGGDFSSVSVNPAGLGVYRSSELMFTPSMRINSSEGVYLGTSTSEGNVRFNINNFGMVFTDAPKGKRYDRRKWKTVSLAIGMNRVADFNRNYTYKGTNYANSASLAYEADANAYPADAQSSTALTAPGYVAFQGYVINPSDLLPDTYHSIVPFTSGINQQKSVRERGRITEYTISLGGNYEEKLMLGATVGIPTLKYKLNSDFSESILPGATPNSDSFYSFNYSQALTLTGAGVNLKLGAIYKANDNVRIGAAFHTPTVYNITDVYSNGMISEIGNTVHEVSTANGRAADNRFNYSFFSPWRSILSASYIMKGKGFITLDYEYIGYQSMGFLYPSDDGYGGSYSQEQSDMNSAVKIAYQNTSNVRLGAEALLTKFLMARAGFGYYGNPYQAANTNGQRTDFSGGIGFRDDGFFADIAFVHSAYKVTARPYSIDYTNVKSASTLTQPQESTTSFGINNVALTIGFKF